MREREREILKSSFTRRERKREGERGGDEKHGRKTIPKNPLHFLSIITGVEKRSENISIFQEGLSLSLPLSLSFSFIPSITFNRRTSLHLFFPFFSFFPSPSLSISNPTFKSNCHSFHGKIIKIYRIHSTE
mgnify:CR=1 FL=1